MTIDNGQKEDLVDVAATLVQLVELAEEERAVDARLKGYLAELGLVVAELGLLTMTINPRREL